MYCLTDIRNRNNLFRKIFLCNPTTVQISQERPQHTEVAPCARFGIIAERDLYEGVYIIKGKLGIRCHSSVVNKICKAKYSFLV